MKNLKYNTITIQERAAQSLLVGILVLAAIYCVLLISIIFSVIEQKKNNVASIDITSQLTSIENKYASQIALLDDTKMASLNYKHITSTSFAVRKDNVASYTFLYER